MISNRSILSAVILGTAVAVVLPATAEAQKIQGVRPDVHLTMGYDDLGVGFRIDIPVVRDGWLRARNIDDEFAISAGLDMMFVDYDGRDRYYCNGGGSRCRTEGDFGVWPVVVGQWNLYFTRTKWSVFPELGMAVLFGNGYYDRYHRGHAYVTPAASVGARYHFNSRMSLLMRMNYPAGAQIGLTF